MSAGILVSCLERSKTADRLCLPLSLAQFQFDVSCRDFRGRDYCLSAINFQTPACVGLSGVK